MGNEFESVKETELFAASRMTLFTDTIETDITVVTLRFRGGMKNTSGPVSLAATISTVPNPPPYSRGVFEYKKSYRGGDSHDRYPVLVVCDNDVGSIGENCVVFGEIAINKVNWHSDDISTVQMTSNASAGLFNMSVASFSSGGYINSGFNQGQELYLNVSVSVGNAANYPDFSF